MNIQSNFGDYYDSCSYMCGENVFYKRIINNRVLVGGNKNEWGYTQHKRFTEDNKLLSNLHSVFNKYTPIGDCAVLLIGEKVYSFILRRTVNYTEAPKDMYSNPKDIYKYHISFEGNTPQEKQHLAANYIDLYNAIRVIDTSPIILFSSYRDQTDQHSGQEMDTPVVLNPQLKRIGLSKFIPNYEVIQELELYINNCTNTESTITLSDVQKANNAGFDKHSFRH